MDPRAVSVLRAAGYPVHRHRARQVRRGELGERDLVLAMTARHVQVLRTLAPDARVADRVRMIRSLDPAAADAGGSEDDPRLDVADPWYGGIRDFEATLAQIEAAADGVVELVRSEIASRR